MTTDPNEYDEGFIFPKDTTDTNCGCLPSLIVLVLTCLMLFLLASCTTTQSAYCPPVPKGGPDVAAELSELPEARYPHLWDWLKRLRTYAAACGAINGTI